MTKQAVFTLKIENELRDEFMAEARAAHRPASQLVRDFMREFVDHQHQAREHDAWFKNQVLESINNNSHSIPHDEVMNKMKARVQARLADKDKR